MNKKNKESKILTKHKLKTSLHLSLAAIAMTMSLQVLAQDTLLIADAFVDVAAGKTIKDIAIVISDNQITQVTQQSKIPTNNDYDLVDLSGKTLLPGVMDMHLMQRIIF